MLVDACCSRWRNLLVEFNRQIRNGLDELGWVLGRFAAPAEIFLISFFVCV